jgi:hypothetical protein
MFEESIVDTSTIKVLDEYIKSKEQYFYITDIFNVEHNNKIFNVNFIISNKIEIGKEIIQTNITMTDFKKIFGSYFKSYNRIIEYKKHNSSKDRKSVPKLSLPVYDFLEMFFENFIKNVQDNFEDEKTIYFDNPISINAQSSSNRTGYGNEYYYDMLIYEGTKYGETSEFPIVGYEVEYNKEWTERFCKRNP